MPPHRSILLDSQRQPVGCCVVIVALCATVVGCSSGGGGSAGPVVTLPPPDPLTTLSSTVAAALSPGNASGQDEDPAILRAADGKLYAAWYSNRNPRQSDGAQDKEIFLARSVDGRNWSDPPIQLTQSLAEAGTPSLAQDARGTFHLAWTRTMFTPQGCVAANNCTGSMSLVLYKSSADGVTWNLAEETIVAVGPGDWLPSIVYDNQANRLLIFFASVTRDASGNPSLAQLINRLYVVINSGAGWSRPQRLNGVNLGNTQNNFPHVVQRADGQFLMAWTRYESGVVDPTASTKELSSDTLWASSPDGLNWNVPTVLSDNDTLAALDVLPSLYFDPGKSEWTAAWLNAPNAATVGKTVEMRIGGSYPTDLRNRPELAGYSGRVLSTATPGIFWGVWVAGVEPTQKIQYRFFTR